MSDDYIVDDTFRYSELTVPIIHEDKLIGVIDSEHPEKGYFSSTHLKILTTIASMVAIKIVQARHLENLIQRESRLDLIYSSTNDLIFLMSVDSNDEFRCVSANHAYLELTGRSPEDVIGKTIHEIWIEEKASFIVSQYKKAIETKKSVTYELNYSVRHQEKWVETRIKPVYDNNGHCIHLCGISRDVTASKKVKEELNEEREKYQTLFSKANDAIFILERDRIVECNDQTLKIFGRSRKELIGLSPHELSPDYQPDGKSSNREMDIVSFQWIHNKGDESTFTAEVRLSKFHIQNKEYSLAIVRDVSMRVEAEEKLIESKLRFELLFESSPNAIFIHDYEVIVNVNQAFLDQFGYQEKSQVIGKNALKTTVLEDDLHIVKKARKIQENQNFSFIPSIRLKRKDGSIFISETYISSLIIENKVHLQVISTDITERKQAEDVLKKSEKEYRALFENSLDGIYKSTPEGRFEAVSPALVDMLGYSSAKELMSIDIKKELYFSVADRYNITSNEEEPFKMKKKDGSVIWVEDHSFYQHDEQGIIKYNRGILRDVTAKKLKQEELLKLLNMTNDQNKRLQNFAHIIFHNIRSHSANLTSLIAFMEKAKSDQEKGDMFKMLKGSTEKLEETILNLNEIITVNQNLNKPSELKNLKKEVANTLKILTAELHDNEIQVKMSISSRIELNVIPAYLDSILLNLISNAVKYKRESVKAEVNISAYKKDGKVYLEIADNGMGIDLKQYADKIFGMYNTFHGNEDARGFGLYITKNQGKQ